MKDAPRQRTRLEEKARAEQREAMQARLFFLQLGVEYVPGTRIHDSVVAILGHVEELIDLLDKEADNSRDE